MLNVAVLLTPLWIMMSITTFYAASA